MNLLVSHRASRKYLKFLLIFEKLSYLDIYILTIANLKSTNKLCFKI